MLPMILSFLGSAFAPAIAGATGIAALANPLIAGAIGSGLGAAIQTGSLKEGLKSGLGSFVGGKLLGGLMGSTSSGALQQPLSGQSTIGAGANAMTAGAPLTRAIMPPTGGSASPFGLGGLKSAMQSAMQSGMSFAQSPQGIGSMIGASLAAPVPTFKTPPITPETYDPSAEREMQPIPMQVRTPPADYIPGVSPEFDYGIAAPQSYQDLMAYNDRVSGPIPKVPTTPTKKPKRTMFMAEGGEAEIEVDDETGDMEVEAKRPVAGNEKTEIVDAIKAIKGMHPQPEIALGKFLAKYGEDALRDLVDSVQSGEFDETLSRFERGEKGMVRGPGDGSGKDDKVPATIDGEQDVLLTEGEFVMRKDATDALEKMYGGGFLSAVNKAGKRAPEVLKKKVAA